MTTTTPTPETRPDGLEVPLTHHFVDAVPELALDWSAEPAPEPRLLVLDDDLAADLGLDPAALRTGTGLGLLTGTALPEGAHTVAQGYAGHQFGGWSPRLGDGRAVLLGELTDREGRVRDLHLKGSGRTPWSRGGDGRATVGPMLREVVVSRSLHALGIPTTRALAVVATGRAVQREEPLPGAVLTRVAASHLRVGSFQHARALVDAGDADPSLLARLADLAIERHHPQAGAGATAVERHTALYDAVVAAQAHLVAQWMLVGFVHGVLNTDNVLISGESIDFGPCAFLDAHDPAAVFSSIDQAGRYAFGNQPAVTAWNLARLGEAMLPLLDQDQEQAVAVATDVLSRFAPLFAGAFVEGMRAKLGLSAEVPDEVLRPLVEDLQALLREAHADHTGFFRALAAHARGDREAARGLVLDLPAYDAWAGRWLALGPDAAAMDRVNPLYIPRNHLVEEALAAAVDGDLQPFEQLLDVVSHPYDERPGLERCTQPAPDDLGPYTTYCGT